MNRRKLLARLAAGSFQNVAFGDVADLAAGFGFELVLLRLVERDNLRLEDR